MTTAVPCCLGKLPIHGDFIRWNHQQVPEVVEFDAWMLDGMERAYEARGRAFEADLRRLPAFRFLFTSARTNRVLAGTVVASQDQVGRVYPFTVAFLLGAVAAGPAYDRLPVTTAGPLAAAMDLARGDLAGTTLPALLDRVQALGCDLDEQVGEHELRTYLFGTTVDQVLAEGQTLQSPARRELFAQELRRLTEPPFPPRYVASVPAHGLGAATAFWLTVLRQWLPVRRNPTLVVWPAAADPHPTARLLFDDLHARYFGPAVFLVPDSQHALDLARPVAARQEPASAHPLLRARSLLQDVVLAARDM